MIHIRELPDGKVWKPTMCAVLVLLVSLPAWSAPGDKEKKELEVRDQLRKELIWPGPPDIPRIRWFDSFAGASHVEPKKKRGFFSVLAGAPEVNPDKEIKNPYGVATDSRGWVYVADTKTHGVWVFKLKEKKVDQITGRNWSYLEVPTGIAIDREDRLYVADAVGRAVICFGPEGEAIRQFGRGELGRPVGVAVDSKRRRLYVADVANHRISVFDTETGTLLEHIGEKSSHSEPGKFNAPANVAVDRRGFLYVVDSFNYRVQIFNRRGKFVRTFGDHGDAPGYFARPKGIAVDSEGHIYVADAMFGNVQVFNQEGKTLMFFGDHGPRPGEFILVTGLHIDRNDRIYTTEQYLGRVQIFDYLSQPETVAAEEVMQE